MNDLYYQDDREPTQSELEQISGLSSDQIAEIDNDILTVVDVRFKKVAMIVAMVKAIQPESTRHFPDTFFTRRIAHLVSTDQLEAQGNLKKMRFSEVRLNR
jgi:hypothetical protein